jgi:nucleoside-diphosphate-sugar epimerase
MDGDATLEGGMFRRRTAVTPNMRIVIAGAHGQIARHLTRLLTQHGHEVHGIIRNPDHTTDIENDGGTPVLLDLESASPDQVAEALTGADAAVFAAGAGPGSSIERKDTVDNAASVLLADAAELAGVTRFLQVSSIRVDSVLGGNRPDGLTDVFYAYLQAKLAAEEDLIARKALSWTIVRPGGLTDDPPTGRVDLSSPADYGTVPRADVAAVLARLLETRLGHHRVLELMSGPESVEDAVAALAR